MNITIKPCQNKAVENIVTTIQSLQDNPLLGNKITLHAPTGSGKTVILSQVIAQALFDHVVIVLSPGSGNLEDQTRNALSRYLEGTSITVSDLTLETFTNATMGGEVFVKNWESLVSRDRITGEYNSILTRSNEMKNFFDWISDIAARHVPISIIIDEAHYGAKNSALSIQDFMQRLETITTIQGVKPLRIEASATPMFTDHSVVVKVTYKDAIADGLVRSSIMVNPDIHHDFKDGDDILDTESLLIESALKKQSELHNLYKLIGIDTIPLIAIQIPNSNIGKECKDRVLMLLAKHNLTFDNGMVAEYFAESKTKNMIGLEKDDSPVRVLLYKQGIAMGWDCPRAQILIGFRHIKSQPFSTQNIGRFLRTTQGKVFSTPAGSPYDFESLNYAYVYTNKTLAEINTEQHTLLEGDGVSYNVIIPLRHSPDGTGDDLVKAVEKLNTYNLPQSTVTRSYVSTETITKMKKDIAQAISGLVQDLTIGEVGKENIEVGGTYDTSHLDTGSTVRKGNPHVLSSVQAPTTIKENYVKVIKSLIPSDIHNRFKDKVTTTIIESIESTVKVFHKNSTIDEVRHHLSLDKNTSQVKSMVEAISKLDVFDMDDDTFNAEYSKISVLPGFFLPNTITAKDCGKSRHEDGSIALYAQWDDKQLFYRAPHVGVFDEDTDKHSSLDSKPEMRFYENIKNSYMKGRDDDFELVAIHKFPGYEKREGSFTLGVAVNYMEGEKKKNSRFFPDFLLFFKDKNNGRIFPMVIEIKGSDTKESKDLLAAKVIASRQYSDNTGLPLEMLQEKSPGSFISMKDNTSQIKTLIEKASAADIKHFDENYDASWLLTLGIEDE